MSVWNTFNPDLIQEVFEGDKHGESIAEKVRKAAARDHR